MLVHQLDCVVDQGTVRCKTDCLEGVELGFCQKLVEKGLGTLRPGSAFILVLDPSDQLFVFLHVSDEVLDAEDGRVGEVFRQLDDAERAYHFVAAQLRD